MQFIDLVAQQVRIKDRIDMRIKAVLAHGQYILGPEVKELEGKLAAFCGVKHAVTCANGTDALQLALMALGFAAGDAVFIPSFTFAATAEVVPFVGATPVFVDIDPVTYNMDVESLKRAVLHAREIGLRPAAIIPVDLFGLPADYDALNEVARNESLFVIEDSAQGWGATYKGSITGSFGDIATTSFFPAKPLGCYGDGGAIFTNDDELAFLLYSLRNHGQGSEKYDNLRIGMNSRLDTLQASILLEKLSIYADEIVARQTVAQRYNLALGNTITTPYVPEGSKSIWAQYTLRAKDRVQRDALMASLRKNDIPSVVYYPKPVHKQFAYQKFPKDPAGLSKSLEAAECVFSLPMSAYVTPDEQEKICSVLSDACARSKDGGV